MPLKLTYMAVRARAEATRMILAYAGIEYEFVNLTTRKAIAEAKSLRTTASAAKGGRDDLYMTWGQLPVLELDDGTSFTQSGSVVRAAAKLAGLYPADIGQMTGVNPIINVFTGEKEATAKAAYLAQLPKRLRFLTLVLGDDDYFYGALSFADFGIAAVLDNVLTMEPTALDEFETMKAHHKRVTSLPKVSDYMASRDPVVKFAPPSAAPAAPAAAAAPAATPAAGAGTGSGAGSAAAST